MSYKSPIEVVFTDYNKRLEDCVLDEVNRYCRSNFSVSLDEEELEKALRYDREQYEKGYADAKNELITECTYCEYFSGRNDEAGVYTVIGYCDHPRHHIYPCRYDFYCKDAKRRETEKE